MIAMGVARRCLEFIVEGLLPVHASGWTGDHAHALAGAERRLRDAQRPLTHHRPLYFIQRPLSRIASMPATGQ
jgi:hypothetical protein